MPELPEIETIRIGLKEKIVGKTIQGIEVLSAKSFTGDFKKVKGQKILNVWRKAKILGVNLDKITLLFHLKMTGQLIYDDGKRFIGGHPTPDMVGPLPNKSTRVIFKFNDGSKLYFNDQRRFGWIRIVEEIEDLFKKLGPEPLEKEFSWQILKQNLLRHKNMPVKVVLMDQSIVSGIGNIYANEACFNAKIDPRTKVGDLTDKQFESLHRGVLKALRDGIKYGGASRAHFVDSQGHKGYFLDYAYVYGRDKHKCKKCGTAIQKIQLNGRGTYFCSKCQK